MDLKRDQHQLAASRAGWNAVVHLYERRFVNSVQAVTLPTSGALHAGGIRHDDDECGSEAFTIDLAASSANPTSLGTLDPLATTPRVLGIGTH